ncbi:MAG: anaerobic benzoate catabolism transcriptional regulator [bacterium ADurb.Bin212]|nr:MAG: anaerobic benzoate catabolism transcriptional regulator [bacterium ADurb.Bin212]
MTAKHSGNIYKGLGDKLKKYREAAKMTQAKVAELAGIHVNYYARMERGEENPTLEVLHKLKEVLKIKSDLV